MHENLFPLFLKLEGVDVLVVGAGEVAARKIKALLECGARVRVVAPEAAPEILTLAAAERITLFLKPYGADELASFGARFLFAATPDAALNRRIALEARRAKVFVNVADAPELCDFYLPAVLRRGPLQIAVSTGGAAPGLARQLRDELAERYGDTWADFLRVLGKRRREWIEAEKNKP